MKHDIQRMYIYICVCVFVFVHDPVEFLPDKFQNSISFPCVLCRVFLQEAEGDTLTDGWFNKDRWQSKTNP